MDKWKRRMEFRNSKERNMAPRKKTAGVLVKEATAAVEKTAEKKTAAKKTAAKSKSIKNVVKEPNKDKKISDAGNGGIIYESNTLIKLKKELIENLEDKIRLLEEENKQMDEIVKKFSEAYDSLQELCNSQQKLLEHLQDESDSQDFN